MTFFWNIAKRGQVGAARSRVQVIAVGCQRAFAARMAVTWFERHLAADLFCEPHETKNPNWNPTLLYRHLEQSADVCYESGHFLPPRKKLAHSNTYYRLLRFLAGSKLLRLKITKKYQQLKIQSQQLIKKYFEIFLYFEKRKLLRHFCHLDDWQLTNFVVINPHMNRLHFAISSSVCCILSDKHLAKMCHFQRKMRNELSHKS
jgi:hypothetical protein